MPSHGHYDRTPSLRLHLDDGIFHCFGCGVRGDVVEWVEQTEGVGWREAIRVLDSGARLTNVWGGGGSERRTGASGAATRRGDRWAPEHPDLERTAPGRVFAAVDAAWRLYSQAVTHELGARYLLSRGIDIRVLEDFVGRSEMGHAPSGTAPLAAALTKAGFGADELVDAGLVCRWPDGRVHDFYRQRVLVPVRDDEGRVCGLIGRNVGDDRFPKYKNPPRTHAYDKSVNLYRPLPAPTASGRGQVVIVEGVMDALAIAVAAVRVGSAGDFCPITQSGRRLSR